MNMIEVQVIDNSNRILLQVTDQRLNVNISDDKIQALSITAKNQPAVVLLHYNIQNDETGKYIRLLLKRSKNTKIIVLAENISEDEILNCFLAGAKGFMSINEINQFAHKAISVVSTGEAWIKRNMVPGLVANLRRDYVYA
jgi:DNA-binding NarL/FixJ family response regulator